MSRTIDYYFSMASPWAYLGHARFMEIAQAHGASVTILPLPLRRLFPETGGLPLPQRHPVRQRYRLVELQRWSARRGLPLVPQPRHVPFDPTLLDLAVTALVLDGQNPDAFMRRAFAAVWAEEQDLADPATIGRLAGTPDLTTRAQDADVLARYEATLPQALEAGVFGAPSYVLDGEVFWGQDRLDLLDDALASGRPPYRP
jgi:2-hydroxychromene-2-carboxylate isomerase